MKRFYDPITEKRINKKKALEIVEETGKMLIKETMTLAELKKYPDLYKEAIEQLGL